VGLRLPALSNPIRMVFNIFDPQDLIVFSAIGLCVSCAKNVRSRKCRERGSPDLVGSVEGSLICEQ
jgi:hypothetical protein